MTLSTQRAGLGRRLAAGATAVALLASGLVAAAAPAAVAAAPASFNPFAMAGGFTVYAREDALLQNQETEGSIAVGGTTTVRSSSGTYSIIHVAAGTADYTLPSVDGDPTRLLTGEYSPQSTGILQITSAGTSDPTLQGDLKLVDRDGPFEPFARADFVRLNTDPANVDQTPLIDATHQQYPVDATPPTGGVGGGSIYTADSGDSAVADYVEANQEANWSDAEQCLADLPSTAYPVGVAGGDLDSLVLETLSADQVNVVDYTDISGAKSIQFSPGPTPGVENPLVIQVPAGTTDVLGARIDPQGQYSPYALWDLSGLTGPVSVTAPDGGNTRIDGSIYAPNADVTVTAAPLDGQIIGQNVTVAGGEVHSFFFQGEITCGAPVPASTGTFSMQKALEGNIPLPTDTFFTVNYTATEPDGTVVEGSLDLPASGAPVAAGVDFPVGTTITFEELSPETVPGWTWSTITIAPITIGDGEPVTITVTNTATRQLGTVSIQKAVVDPDGTAVTGATGVIIAAWEASDGQSGTVTFPVDGTETTLTDSDGPVQFPLGTTVTFSDEDLSDADLPVALQWADAGWDPSNTVTVTETSTTAVTLTNVVVPRGAEARIFTARKALAGDAEQGYDYSIRYRTDVNPEWITRDLRVGAPTLLPGIASDATTLTLVENLPSLNGVPVEPSQWETPVITVGGDAEPLEYGDERTIVLSGTGLVTIEVANELRQGTFDLSKAFGDGSVITGDGTLASRPGFGFTVSWTATTPAGEVTEGIVRLPADGTPVSPLDAAGEPLTFPFGTEISYGEATAPHVPGVEWALPATGALTIGAESAARVSGTVTNTAVWKTGTFEVSKRLVGIDPALLPADTEVTIDYTGQTLSGAPLEGDFTVPVDGTPAGPGESFPVGSVLTLSERSPTVELPPGYEWSGATWGPRSYVVIRDSDTTAPQVLTVINSFAQFTRYSVTKTVTGDAASTMPDGTVFTADAWVDTVAQPEVTLTEGTTVTSRWIPVGSIVEAQEADFPETDGVDWGDPVWALSDGTVLEPEPNGRVVLPAAALGTQNTVALELTNRAMVPEEPATPPEPVTPLPATGGTFSPMVPIGALTAILLGLTLVARRRARTTD